MFTLNRIIARNTRTDPEDTAHTKFALTALGYHDDGKTGLSPYADDDLFESIRTFQKDYGLTIDGIMKPLGETVTKINKKLKENVQYAGAFSDFAKNWKDMVFADTIGADKYFHCKANYEATEKGWENQAYNLSEQRANYKKKIKNNSNLDIFEDHHANIYGRETAKTGKFSSSRDACAVFRPKGLNDKY